MSTGTGKIRVIRVFCGALAGMVLALPCGGLASQLQEDLSWRAQTNKRQYLPGEPVLVTLIISNDANQPKRIAFAGADNAFSIALADANGSPIACRMGSEEPRGVSDKRLLDIPAGGTARRTFVLNHRCSTLIQQGPIIAACTIRYYALSERRPIEINGVATKTRAPERKAQVTFSFEIGAPDDAKYAAILADLARKMSDLRAAGAFAGRQGLEARIAGMEMLAFAEGDAAVRYQLELLRDDRLAYRQMYALESLARTATVSAAKGVIAVLEDPAPKCAIDDENLVLAVYTMRDKDLPGVREATEEFVKKYPRPVKPKVPYVGD